LINYDTQFAKDAGEFFLPETRKWFTFQPNTDDSWGLQHDLIHKVDVLDGYRCAIVRKGVAYIAIDEDAYGKPVLERWTITKRHLFNFNAKNL
jgi:hypothetical protein